MSGHYNVIKTDEKTGEGMRRVILILSAFGEFFISPQQTSPGKRPD